MLHVWTGVLESYWIEGVLNEWLYFAHNLSINITVKAALSYTNFYFCLS